MFVEKILKHTRVCGFLEPYDPKKAQTWGYYIHAGCVDVYDAQTRRLVTTLGKGRAFKVDASADQRRQYRARKENDVPAPMLQEEREHFPFVFLD